MKLKNSKPYPAISENIVKEITDALSKKETPETPKIFIEWGSGKSTLFYLDFMLKNNIEVLYLSVESDFSWHKTVVENIRNRYKHTITEEKSSYEQWSDFKCRKYLNAYDQAISFDVPDSIKMLSIGKNRIEKALLTKDRSEEPFCLVDGYYAACINGMVKFNYILKSECFKDQYGESPIKDEYICGNG